MLFKFDESDKVSTNVYHLAPQANDNKESDCFYLCTVNNRHES